VEALVKVRVQVGVGPLAADLGVVAVCVVAVLIVAVLCTAGNEALASLG
jgi:hypothetical protein